MYYKLFRLSSEVFDQARLAKLMLVMLEGKTHLHKGKTLEEINIDLDTYNQFAEDSDEEDELDTGEDKKDDDDDIDENKDEREDEDELPRKRKRDVWSESEKQLVRKHFRLYFKGKEAKKCPSISECNEMLKKYPNVFSNRKTGDKVCTFIYNTVRTSKN